MWKEYCMGLWPCNDQKSLCVCKYHPTDFIKSAPCLYLRLSGVWNGWRVGETLHLTVRGFLAHTAEPSASLDRKCQQPCKWMANGLHMLLRPRILVTRLLNSRLLTVLCSPCHIFDSFTVQRSLLLTSDQRKTQASLFFIYIQSMVISDIYALTCVNWAQRPLDAKGLSDYVELYKQKMCICGLSSFYSLPRQ